MHRSSITGILILVCGCSLPLKHGSTTHHIILGFGVVSVTEEPGLLLSATSASLGMSASNRPVRLNVGWYSGTTLYVYTNSLVAEIDSRGHIEVIKPN